MNLITVSIGYYLGSLGSFYPYASFAYLLIGTWLVASACGMHNSYFERDLDKKMNRTKKRPLPMGLVCSRTAFLLGGALLALGFAIHAVFVNPLTAGLSFLTWFMYIAVYTPLKTRTWLNTFVGSIPGAIPIIGGWAAATGALDAYAMMLFLVLFAWQHPHFYALAIMYKEDYESAGMKMLPVLDPTGQKTIREIFVYTIIMIVASILPVMFNLLGYIYLGGITLLGVMMFYFAVKLSQNWVIPQARKLFFASIIYLPAWFVLIVVDFWVRSL